MDKTILKTIMAEKKLDVIISFAYQTRLWYANVQTSDGLLTIEKTEANLIVDGRYIEYARKNARNVNVYLRQKGFFKAMPQVKTYKRIGVESEYITLAELTAIKKAFPEATIVEISGKKLRKIKSSQELANLKQACAISLQALASIKHLIKPGISEQVLDRHLNFQMKELGADKESFAAIVVSGARGALPHGQPSSKKLVDGELVTIDFGVYYNGYASDITRTFKVGNVTKELNDIFEIVKIAQQMGIEAIKPGVKLHAIDKICRDYITKQGYGQYFVHSTGHGLGIDVHELPNVSRLGADTLRPGMVITIEPGIYIEGVGGVRFEDDILVTTSGYEVLSTLANKQNNN